MVLFFFSVVVIEAGVGGIPPAPNTLYLVTNDAILVDGLCVGLGEEGLGGGPARPALDRLGVPGPEVDRKFELLPHLRPHGFVFVHSQFSLFPNKFENRYDDRNKHTAYEHNKDTTEI